MDKERCEVIYKKVHGDRVVVVAVSQTVRSSDTTPSRIHLLVCKIIDDPDDYQWELNRRGRPMNGYILCSLVPETYTASAFCQLPTLPMSDGPRGDKAKHEMSLELWSQDIGLKTSDLATSALSQSAAMPEIAEDTLLPHTDVLVTETLIAGAISAWGAPMLQYMTAKGPAITRSLDERRPMVASALRTLGRFGLQNNLRIYAAAFGFGIEKAHKDVRTYRETLRRIDEERRGQK